MDAYHRRREIMAANWKMYKTRGEAQSFAEELLPQIEESSPQVIICAGATLLTTLDRAFAGSSVFVGAQNIHWEEEGAFTGEISATQAADAGAEYVICGHSERRHSFDESNEMITRKVAAAIEHNLTPILCIGETLEEREAGDTFEMLQQDLFASLAGVEPTDRIVIAYEPVWAIGTGKVASAADAESAIGFIRQQLAELWDEELAAQICILYGGSVKPENIAELMACPNIDGALVGGASLKAGSFAAIVNYNA